MAGLERRSPNPTPSPKGPGARRPGASAALAEAFEWSEIAVSDWNLAERESAKLRSWVFAKVRMCLLFLNENTSLDYDMFLCIHEHSPKLVPKCGDECGGRYDGADSKKGRDCTSWQTC